MDPNFLDKDEYIRSLEEQIKYLTKSKKPEDEVRKETLQRLLKTLEGITVTK